MLHLVGLGLADETDITVRGLEIVKRAERVYLEAYTSILLVDKEKLVSWVRSYYYQFHISIEYCICFAQMD
jgi:Diphthamide biosynthesis methyltransferase